MIYRYGIAIKKALFLFFYSIRLFPLRDWLYFWFTFGLTKKIRISNIELNIRATNTKSKIVDLYMAVSCLMWNEYAKSDLALNKSNVVIDIGGHIGSFSLLVGKSGALVYTYEPDPLNYLALLDNIELNNLPNVKAYNLAVSGIPGLVPLYKHRHNTAAHSILATDNNTPISVPCTTLVDILDHNNISSCTFLKLDCEGAEYEILLNTPLNYLSKIERISLEFHLHPKYKPEEIIRYLGRAGFTITKFDKENRVQGIIWAKRS